MSLPVSKKVADIALVGVTIIWGLGFALTKEALDQTTPLAFMAMRFTFASLVLLPFLMRSPARADRWSWVGGGIVGLLLASAFICQTVGLDYTTSGKAAFITGLHVILVPFLATAILRRFPNPWVLTGLGIATPGLALLSFDAQMTFQIGDLWIVISAIFFAFHLVAIAYFVRRGDAMIVATVQILVCAFIAVPASFALEGQWLHTASSVMPSVLITGGLGTAAAFYIVTWAQRIVTPTRTGLIFMLESVFGAVFGWLMMGEALTGKELIGCATILGAMVLVELKSDSAAPPAPKSKPDTHARSRMSSAAACL